MGGFFFWETLIVKLKNILVEDEVDDVFGDVAFGEDSRIVRYQNKSEIEADSELEYKLHRALKNWVSLDNNGRIKASDVLYPYEDLFRKAQTKFPSIFRPTTRNGTALYRGLSWFSPDNARALKEKPIEEFKRISVADTWYWLHPKPIQYNPENELQSWTSSPEVARKFSMSKIGKYSAQYGGLLFTTQNDEFLFNQKFLGRIWTPPEDEVIHFGKKFKKPIHICLHDFYFHSLHGKQPGGFDKEFYKKKSQ